MNMKVSERLIDLIKGLIMYTSDTKRGKTDEIYRAVDRIYLSAQEQAEGYIRNGDFEEAAKVYLLISKALMKSTLQIKDLEVSQTLLSVALSWQSRAEQTLRDAVRYYIDKVYEQQEKGDYEKSTEYMNEARIREYQIQTRSLNEELDKETSNYYESIRSEVDAELKSRRPTIILSEKAAALSERLLKRKPKPPITTLPKAEKSELAAEPRVTPDRITTKNDFAPLRKRKGWYNWSVYLIADDDIKAQIESVTYTLHPTFPQPVRTVKDPSDGFRLRTSGWGEFQIKIDIHLKNGETISKYHWLNLGMGRLRSP